MSAGKPSLRWKLLLQKQVGKRDIFFLFSTKTNFLKMLTRICIETHISLKCHFWNLKHFWNAIHWNFTYSFEVKSSFNSLNKVSLAWTTKKKNRPSANNLAVKDSLSVNMLSYQYRPKTTKSLEEKACNNICP